MSNLIYYGNTSDLEDAFQRVGFTKCAEKGGEIQHCSLKQKGDLILTYYESTHNIHLQNGMIRIYQ
ncbi:MAG: hypothetical protein P857_742 [Candidatus Xenolissoclinum pacificiensis L6]|uniref:Uncharacterized protein n=1 Tax=Candidatus Xenolissoclinum pacificiensis L6 TaxID=1401685 RepID=W2V1E7_9RICK|nr:MAG: hypothetical protein P857_742 [Candidatus Xenolissoclinum pacificiensis L6]